MLGNKAVVKHKPHADINIFTVASGLLYEVRFTARMLVMSHSNCIRLLYSKSALHPS